MLPHSRAGIAFVTKRRIRLANTRESYQECRRIVKAAHSNFYYAFFLLPKPKRDGLAALYAFMDSFRQLADKFHRDAP